MVPEQTGQRCCPFHVQIFKADIEEMSASLSRKTRRTTLSRALGKKMTKPMRCQLCPRRGVEMIPLNIQQKHQHSHGDVGCRILILQLSTITAITITSPPDVPSRMSAMAFPSGLK